MTDLAKMAQAARLQVESDVIAKLRSLGIDPAPVIHRARQRDRRSPLGYIGCLRLEYQAATEGVNMVCPACAEGFDLNGVVVPQTPDHDRCMGTVSDKDAPGGGWTCTCPCRSRT